MDPDVLACPVCDSPLHRIADTFSCQAGHSFDVAREGYVNLLPSQHKSRGIEGDVPEMLEARRRFLDAGYFSPLREALADEVEGIVASRDARSSPARIIDVGCGEGYYIGGVGSKNALRQGKMLLGADLSKSAVKLAARRYPEVLFFVADVHRRVYLQTGSVSAVLDVFAPRNPDEFARVLEPGGSALVVIPSESHLASVRDAFGLLEIQPEKERRVLESFAADFSLVSRREIRYPLELPANAVEDLVNMGPSHWHRSRQPRPAPSGLTLTEASFVLLHLQREVAGRFGQGPGVA